MYRVQKRNKTHTTFRKKNLKEMHHSDNLQVDVWMPVKWI